MASTFKNLPTNFKISEDGTYAVLSVPIEKSDSDDRSYRLIRLSNELEALLVHDAETDKSSAALDVHVGSLCDPDNILGLAHFCEHLLFLGTEKYPIENEYKDYLTKHNGHANASTALGHTNYYFEVGSEFLEGALDRFSQFFIAPLFDPSCVDREIHAIDSENKKNIQLDFRRIFQLERSLSNPEHPFSHFATGNLETLKENPIKQGINIRDELLKFHDKYYSANIMKLVVLGKESLDQLSQWVIEKFSAVRNKSIPIPIFEGHPLTENELLKQVFIKPVKDIRTLKIRFPFPDRRLLFHIQPEAYLTHLIGHEGVGSILSLLKKKGLVNFLNAGYIRMIGFGFFDISIDLTESGLANYEDVVVHVFQYIEMLKQVGVQEWIFHEIRKLREISFRFREKTSPSSYTSSLSGYMHIPFPREQVLSRTLIREYNPQLINESLGLLRHDKFTLGLASQSFVGLDQKEKWYGTEYKMEPLSDKLIKALENITTHSEFKIPIPNEFIPNNFETHKIEVSMPSKRPNLIKNTQICRLWHKKDDTFWVPKARIYIALRSPLAYSTPSHNVKTRLYAELIVDDLNEYLYNAEIAGAGYSVDCQTRGLLLVARGYNDKLPLLIEKIVTKMKSLKVDPKRFILIKERLQRAYKNSLLNSPHQLSAYYLNYLMNDKLWTNEEKLEALQNIECEDIETFYLELLDQLYIELLIHGNISKDDAIKISQKVEEILQPKALVSSQLIGSRSVMIPEGKNFIYQRDVFDSDNVNSAIEYYIQVCDYMDIELRSKLILLAQIVKEPCFDQLRTKEQLAYIVRSGVTSTKSFLGLRIIVQSEKDTIHLENRIEALLEKMKETIENMSETEYQKHTQSIISRLQEKPKNLSQEASKYWGSIGSGYYNFDQNDTDAEEIRKITKQDILEFYEKFINRNSPFYKKLSVHLRSQKLKEKENDAEEGLELKMRDHNEIINDMVLWKSSMKLGSTSVPIVPFRYFEENLL